MPQFNSYPAITELLAADLILVYKDDVGAVKTINAEDLAAAIKALTSRAFIKNIVNSATSLDDTYQFVIANSGSGFNITLPPADENDGISWWITNKGAGTITLLTTGSDTLEGQASITLTQYESVIVISDGIDMYHIFGIAN